MHNSNPFVSVIIPTYNRAHLIEETLYSVLNQEYENWECIIVDDGSTDNTLQIIQSCVQKDKRFRFFIRPAHRKKGANACRNFGLENAKGVFVNFFDSDDIMATTKLQEDVQSLLSSKADFTISQTQFFYSETKKRFKFWNEKLFSKSPIHDFICQKIGWSTNTPLWRLDSLKKSQLIFDETLKNGQDYYFHALALIKGLTPIVNKNVLVYQREHNAKIEHMVIKTPSKAIINLNLLRLKDKLDLETIIFLKNQSFRILSTLYKHKLWLNAISFSIKLIKHNFTFYVVSKIVMLMFFGTFYKLTGMGYSFLK